ncbi:MAG: tetratricopeptide repeat protein [Thermoanaerobaculia bacterium]
MIRVARFVPILLLIFPRSGRGAPCGASEASGPAEAIAARLSDRDPDGAIALGEEATRRCESSAVWLSLGKAYGAKARVASLGSRMHFARKCKAAFVRSVALDPQNIDARIALFTFLLEAPGIAGGSLSTARREAEQIERLDSGRAHRVLGMLAIREKEFPKAEAELQLALAASTDDRDRADVQCQLATAYERLGKRAEAIAALREALRLEPANSPARKALERLGE